MLERTSVDNVIGSRLAIATAIVGEIQSIKKDSIANFIRLSELFRSLYQDKYFEELGFDNFKECLENSGLDISLTQAYRMIRLAEGINKLGIPTKELNIYKPTYLLEVFSLEDEVEIKKLLEAHDNTTVNEVKELVREKKGYDKGYFIKFKVNLDTKKMIDDVHKLIREKNGQSVGYNQEVKELSDSQCLEYVYVEMWNSLI